MNKKILKAIKIAIVIFVAKPLINATGYKTSFGNCITPNRETMSVKIRIIDVNGKINKFDIN